MFTGLIEDIGRVVRAEPTATAYTLHIASGLPIREIRIGDSIAVDGCCLTVVSTAADGFAVQAAPETLGRTTVPLLRRGDQVNLERPLRLGGRLDGHLVQGHVDGVGRIVARRQVESALYLEIEAPEDVLQVTIARGSVAVDGVSLTVSERGSRTLTVSLIPHTREVTALGSKPVGAPVNLEGDLIGKYVARMLHPRGAAAERRGIDEAFLREHGFLG